MIHFTKRFLPNNVAKSENVYEDIFFIFKWLPFYSMITLAKMLKMLFSSRKAISLPSAIILSFLHYYIPNKGKSFLLQLLLVNYSDVCQLFHSHHFTWNFTSLCVVPPAILPTSTALASNNKVFNYVSTVFFFLKFTE